ncbi:hypothetical protein F4803DRAFT_508151 [Xylaria telfairii]|nr:hypothetical protein F4803DRAFT_508151 [Xylaria telfairii]
MSLGVRLLWRARSRISPVQGLSLVPRESRNPLFASRIQARCWLSSSSAEAAAPAGEPTDPTLEKSSEKADRVEKADRSLRSKSGRTSQHSAWAKTTSTSSTSRMARRWLFPRHVAKKQIPGPQANPLVKQPIQYPDRLSSRRSLRRHVVSSRRQELHEHIRTASGKPANTWHSTLDFMIRHTPKFGEILDFKVGIGKRARVQAQATLSELDTNLWQIQQRHHCKIHIVSGFEEDEPLILSLTGTDVSVRESLLEIVRNIGKVFAVRVLDPKLQISSPETWKGSSQGQLPIQLLGDDESASEDDIVTVYGHSAELARMAQRPKHKLYQLTTRANEIPKPTSWTKSSFEQYVAKLVFARVPTHLHKSLYPVGPDHQSIVVQLLTDLFTSEDLRAVASVAALKLALRFIHIPGPKFGPAARTIMYEAELQHLPLDAEAFHILLISASKAGDLGGFNSIVRAMQKKGHYMRVETWTAFLSMIQDPHIKYFVMRKMRSRGLRRLQPVLEELGRQNIILDLERRAGTEMNMQQMLNVQDRRYGPSWLNTITLNRMIYVIGAQGNLRACHELLDLVVSNQRVQLVGYTLNTMMTNTKSIPQKLALLSRWPGLEPDNLTYKLLFKMAWKQRLPNMLRVIWRYAAFSGLSSSHMRHTLDKVLRPSLVLSNNLAFLKAWEDAIFGSSELAASRLPEPNGFGAAELMKKYIKDAGNLRPLVGLGAKLQEAYDMDMRIHKLNGEGVEVLSMRESLTVDIPLGPKQRHAGALEVRVSYPSFRCIST